MLPIETTSDYLKKILNVEEDSIEFSNFYEDNYDQIRLIGEILSIENAIYLLRRSNQLCGSHIDNIIPIRGRLISEYESKYSNWIRDNEEEMY